MTDPLSDHAKRIDEKANELENNLNCDLILLVFHDYTQITHDVVEDLEFYIDSKDIDKSEKESLCVMLYTFGGSADAAYHIGTRLQDFAGNKKLIFIVPRYAKSAGTLLACSGDEIYATPITELGPIDPQVYVKGTGSWISAKVAKDSLKQILETMKEVGVLNSDTLRSALRETHATELGHYNSLINHIKELTTELLSRRMFKDNPSKAKEIAEKLVEGYSYHGRCINFAECKRIGLNVKMVEDEKRKAIYSVYRAIKDFLDEVDKLLAPMMEIIREIGRPAQIPYELDHGYIYIPEFELEGF